MNRSKLGVLLIIALLLLSFPVSLVAAQSPYKSKTVDLTIGSNGLFIETDSEFGMTITIEGTPGAMGIATLVVYTGNPQVTADVPRGISLSHFIAIIFDMNAAEFGSATITINYNDNDVAGMDQPFSVYKYLPDSDSYVELSTVVDTVAKTMTVTLNSVDDPILAVGGLTAEVPEDMTTTWVVVAVAVVIIVLVAVILVLRWRRM